MSCEVKFEKVLQTGCIVSVTSDIIAGRMSVEVAQKVLWVAGCAIALFGEDTPEQTPNSILVALDGQEPTLELVAQKLNDLFTTESPIAFAANEDPTKAIDPATLMMLLQFGKMALEWIQSRRKNK
jgi:hypothetical protein